MIFKIILSKQVVYTALKLSLLVGTLLAFINHGADIIDNTLSNRQVIQILTTYLVPYAVSTYSSVKVIISNQSKIKKTEK
ncbi:nitrate/nitrite transporter NrtS [Flammeovirga sp. OC4]|uniref:nitrate/nitrite transporter NrtS n=1 Tax=Flammeovirga sp. OC4 TaxID=1382345 RepID=UPI0005C662B5|nr:nitrate/nitrite transporter NrtS [Flammeovirga sp. OC4]